MLCRFFVSLWEHEPILHWGTLWIVQSALQQSTHATLLRETKTKIGEWMNPHLALVFREKKILQSLAYKWTLCKFEHSTSIVPIIFNNGSTDDKSSIAHGMNIYFTIVGQNITNDILTCPNDSINMFSSLSRCSNTFYLHPINESQGMELINDLDPNKIAGYDGIAVKFFKFCSHIASLLTKITSCSSYLNGVPPKLLIE